MKRLLPLLFYFALTSSGVQAQRSPAHPFTGPVAEELSMASYPADPEAEAVVIRELGDYYFLIKETPRGYHFELYMVVTTKLKVLSEAGIELADIEVPYFYDGSDNSDQVAVEGVTYNVENGMITQTALEPRNVYTEDLPNNVRVKKAAMPNVKVGSVVETRYTITTTRLFAMRPWRFQKNIPVIHSMLQYRATPFYAYEFILKGADGFDEFDSVTDNHEHTFSKFKYKETIYRFVKNDLPAFRDEEFLYNTDDLMANLYFQMSQYYNARTGTNIEIASTWPKLCSELRKEPNFGKYINASEKSAAKMLPGLDLDALDGVGKIRAITDHVKAMYTWDGYNRLMASSSVKDFLARGSGNSADLNLFLIGMLKAAGLEAYPVALSTRYHGRIYTEYPFLQFFDYVIGMVEEGGKLHFVDATNRMGKFDEVSLQCANVQGLIITDREEGWIDIVQQGVALEAAYVKIIFEPGEGVAEFETAIVYSGSRATAERRRYNGDQGRLEESLRKTPGVVIHSVEAENLLSVSEPFRVKSRYRLASAEPGADKIILNPLIHIAPSENPFRQSARSHLLDLIYATGGNYAAEIIIPEGYEVEYIAPPAEGSIPGGSYAYSATATGDKIMIHASFKLRNVFGPDEYLPLKQLYGDMVDKFSEAVIIKKATGE